MEGYIFITATEVAKLLDVSKPYSYRIIKAMNVEVHGMLITRNYNIIERYSQIPIRY